MLYLLAKQTFNGLSYFLKLKTLLELYFGFFTEIFLYTLLDIESVNLFEKV